MGRRAKLNKERSIPVALSLKNWEFLKQHTSRGKKLDDFVTIMIADWANITELKEAAEFYSTEYGNSLKSIKKYRQGLDELLRIETIGDDLRFKINSVLGYNDGNGNQVGPSRGVAEQTPIVLNNVSTNLPKFMEVIEKT